MTDDGAEPETEPQDEGAADDADVEAAIEQEPADPTEGEPVDAPADSTEGEPVDAPDDEAGATGTDQSGGDDEAGGDAAEEGAAADAASGTSGSASGGETIEVEVPANLLRAWEHRASKAKLSISEYVVRMTEAGRMSVQMQPAGGGGDAAMSVEQLSDDVVELLRHEDAVSWEELLDAISQNLEEQLEEALERLQEDDVVRYSGLKGGYRLVEEDS